MNRRSFNFKKILQKFPQRFQPLVGKLLALPKKSPTTPISGILGLELGFVIILLSACNGAFAAAAEADLGVQTDQHWTMLDQYCLDCHNTEDWAGQLALDLLNPETIPEEAEVWEKVIRKLRGRMMPPPGEERPGSQQIDGFVGWLEENIDDGARESNATEVPLHRLNRTEYGNVIRDLLALEVDPEELLPVDGAEDGFDNVASALQVSPSFIDQYLNAARVISEQAIGSADATAYGTPYVVAADGQQFYIEGLPLGTRGGAVVEHYFPADGEYRLNIGDMVTGLWGFNQEHVNTLIATIDGRKFFQLDIGGGDDLKQLDQLMAPAVDEINARLKNIAFEATAGPHKIGISFLQRSFAESDASLRLLTPGGGQDAVLKLDRFEIFGPVLATGLSETPSRKKIFTCYPDDMEVTTATCSAEIITNLASRAFRGLFNADDLNQLQKFYQLGMKNGEFEEGIKFALAGILVHPKFLYRLETPPVETLPGEVYELSAVELASRLSFFLWSSIPDDELLQAAIQGNLSKLEDLEYQVRRMLADPRSESLASNFSYQWLGLGELDSIEPDPQLFSDVDGRIRETFVTELGLFVDSIFRADRSVVELLNAQHSYLNETLALHYGINNVRGDHFRRVELSDQNRWGLLGKGGVLMVSSYPNRTAPVLRGAWLLENIMGTPPAAPPPNVEGLIENVVGEVATTVRERLEAHRVNPSCNGCHGVLDPLGFALENFDAVGRWRDKDRESGAIIDAQGVLPDGRELGGPIALRLALEERPELFVQTLTEKLMIYALGRTLEYQDMPVVRHIVRESEKENYQFSSLILNIVLSDAFRKKRLPDVDDLSIALNTEPGE